MKVTIELELKADRDIDSRTLREAVYRYLLELIDDDALDFSYDASKK